MEEQEKINQKQKEFYNKMEKGLASKIWFFFRNGLLQDTRKTLGVEKEVYEVHRKWFGDLSTKKVLDLGCYEGNSLTFHLASEAKEYIGIDLSEKGIQYLNRRLEKMPQAKGIVVDFMSDDFQETDFDLIYAYGVLHHFRNTDQVIERLQEKLASKGEIISNDPLNTNLLVKLIRTFYRPFQSDKAWEWPFSKRTYYKYNKSFNIKERHAVLGKSKWYFLLNLMPVARQRKIAIGKNWQQQDWEQSAQSDKHMFQCMHLTMLMQKKE